jgi:hypothetical protein
MAEEHVLADIEEILGDQSFDMSDDGEIQVDMDQLRAEPAPTEISEETPTETPAPSHDYEKRYKDLEPEFTRRSQKLADLENNVLPQMQAAMANMQGQLTAMQGGVDPTAPADDRVEIPENFGEILMQDPGQGATLIADIADRVAARKLGPIIERVAPMLEDWELESELRTAALKPGREDFFELLPAIRDIIVKSSEDVSFDSAYELAKTFKGVDQPAAPTQAQEPTAQPAQSTDLVSPAEAVQRAARLAPDTGVSGEVKPTQRVADSVEDAFNMAVEDVLGD